MSIKATIHPASDDGRSSPSPLRAFLVAGIIAFSSGTAWAETEIWRVGGEGLSWALQSGVSAAIDFEKSTNSVKPKGFSPEENIVSTVEWLDGRPEDFAVEGQAYVWDNVAVRASNLVMLDGDSTTSTGERFKEFGINQTGRIFYFDLGASYPANRIVLYPSPDAEENFVRAFEISASDGRTFGTGGQPIYDVLRRVETSKSRADIGFPLQLVRFVKLRILAPNPFDIAELEVYGEGFVPKASYLSKLIEFEDPVNFGSLYVEAIEDGEALPDEEENEVFAELRVRNGADDTPMVYYRTDPETQREEEVSEADYEGLLEAEQGPIRYDAAHWSPWSKPLRITAGDSFMLPLDFLPGPRGYFQISLLFAGASSRVIGIASLSLTHSSALTGNALGEVALQGQPDPPGGIVTTKTGVTTVFTYDVRAEFDGRRLPGFDGIRIETPGQSRFVVMEMGTPSVEVTPDSVRAEGTYLAVYFPSRRITPENNQPVRVVFESTPLLYNTIFRGWLLDTGGDLPQPILAGNATAEVTTNALSVFGSIEKPLGRFALSSGCVTPNGDGRNDEIGISYDIIFLVERVRVDVGIYDLSGHRVRQIFSGSLDVGKYEDLWDGSDDEGNVVSPGIYICRISVDTQTGTHDRAKSVAVAY